MSLGCLDEDEEWLFEVAEEMDTEDGQLWVVGVGEDGVMAFTDDGIENLKELIAIHKDTPSIIEKRRQALAAMMKPKTEESDETRTANRIDQRACGLQRMVTMIQLAWRFVRFQKNSTLSQWFAARTADGRASTRKTMIVALARKLLIALWRLVTRARFRRASCYVRRHERQHGKRATTGQTAWQPVLGVCR